MTLIGQGSECDNPLIRVGSGAQKMATPLSLFLTANEHKILCTGITFGLLLLELLS